MGGKKKITIGYWYHLAAHFGVGLGPVDQVLEFRGGGKTAWAGGVSSSGTINIDAPNLWGGEKDQGGIQTAVDLMFGEESQVPNSYLGGVFGEQQPAWRGHFTFALKGGKYGALSPYPQKLSVKFKKILKGWDGDPWYPEMAAVVTATLPETTVRLMWKQSSFHDDNNDHARMGIRFYDRDRTELGSEFAAMIGTAHQVWTPQVLFATAPAGTAFMRVYMEMERLEGDNNDGYIDDIELTVGFDPLVEGSGSVWQLLNAGAEEGNTSGWTNELGGLDVRASGPAPATGSWYFTGGTSPLTRAYQEVVPAMIGMNPAHVLYYSQTNGDMGREQPGNINEASFGAGADWFFAQGFGICTSYDPGQESTDDFVNRIGRVCGCSVNRSIVDSQLYLDIANGEYDFDALPILTDDDILEFSETPSSLENAVNSVSVQYFDVARNEKVITPPVRALGLAREYGTVHQTLEYPEIPSAELALRVALRELRARCTPSRTYELKTTRAPYAWRPNTYFRLQMPKRGVADMVCLLVEKKSGTLRSGALSIIATQDIYSLPSTSYVDFESGVDTRPDQVPKVITAQRAFEAPYVMLAGAMSPGDFSVLASDAGFLAAAAVDPGTSRDFTLMVSPDGTETYADEGGSDFCPTAVVVESADQKATDFTLSGGQRLDLVEVGMLALWDDEFVRVDAIDRAADPATIEFGRGCLDTPPVSHTAGGRLYFVDVAAASDPTEYTDGETVDVKLLTNTGNGQLAVADATAMEVTFDQRAFRPYAPGNLLLNGLAYPSLVTGSVVATWAHRDRVLQQDQLVDTLAGNVGPEAGTTYSYEVYDDDAGTLIGSASAIAAATADLSAVPFAADNRLELWAVRAGVASWRRVKAWFQYPQITGGIGDGAQRLDYLAALSAGGSVTTPIKWSIRSGALPPGVHLITDDSANAQLAGVPLVTASGTYNATLRIKGANGIVSERAIVIRIGTVVSLLHMDGSNGGTAFPDETGRAWTRSGVVTSTAQAKFGATSADFTSGARYLETADANPDLRFNQTAWTIDYWIRPQASGSTWNQILAKRTGGTARPFDFYYTQSPATVVAGLGTSSGEPRTDTGAASISFSGTWYHVMHAKDGNNLHLFLNGVLKSTMPLAGLTVTDATDVLRIGLNNDNNGATQYVGYIDEFRIVKGAAIHTKDFTPPAAAYTYPQTASVLAVNGSLPAGVAATAYSSLTAITIYGSGTPFAVSVSAGTLPTGWSAVVNTNHVEVTGPGVAAGDYTFTLKVQDASLNAVYLPVTVVIA